MMPTHPLRRIALALPMLALALGAPVAAPVAAVIHGSPAARSQAGWAEAGWSTGALNGAGLPAGAAGLRLGGAPAGECSGCGEALAPAAIGRRSATLSVNLAILVLGTLWVALMLRRIQLRSAMEDLRGAGPRHAAGGH